MTKRLRLGMIGGGQGAFIGGVHRIASRIDDRYELVAGCLSSTPEKALASSKEIGINQNRSYPNYITMAEAESSRNDGIEVVAIVTPNHMHALPAIEFIKKGIHVICDKPMTSTMEDAQKLYNIVKESKAHFFLTHNYSGYPVVREMRRLVGEGAIGKVRVVKGSYLQGWLANKEEEKGLKQESDPKALEELIDKVISDNPDKVKEYKSGKEKLFGFFVGQVMKVSGGKANPKLANEILKDKLSK